MKWECRVNAFFSKGELNQADVCSMLYYFTDSHGPPYKKQKWTQHLSFTTIFFKIFLRGSENKQIWLRSYPKFSTIVVDPSY